MQSANVERSKWFRSILRPTVQRRNRKTIYGFDIETYGDMNAFYCLSVWGDVFSKTYFFPSDFISDLKRGLFNDAILVATNLSYDFFGTFTDVSQFDLLFRGSSLIRASTHVHKHGFHKRCKAKRSLVTFLDTANYASMSVHDLGEMLGIEKLEQPACLGRLPNSIEEHEELVVYNMRDSEISCKALQFMYRTFEELGATPKMTLASTAMSLYRNKYLTKDYFRHDTEVLREQFKGYYGGRTEAFSRGVFKDYNYYDFNSLYPDVMREAYPDPNTLRWSERDSDYYILNYPGMSDVTLYCPKMPYPLLPVRTPEKLLFPTGTFRGWYCHHELVRALELGYKLLETHKTYYYTKTCYPFKDYVEMLYEIRRQYKAQGSPMQMVVKILMNGLYGKYGQKFEDKDNVIPFPEDETELDKYAYVQVMPDRKMVLIRQDVEPAPYCIPIWAAYVTAYARMKLHRYIVISNPIYVDTDSLVTRTVFDTSDELGALKLVHQAKHILIVKPKMYLIDDYAKIKGVGGFDVKMSPDLFMEILREGEVSYHRFAKPREAFMRGLIVNQVVPVKKDISLEDTKRQWPAPFSLDRQHSEPIDL